MTRPRTYRGLEEVTEYAVPEPGHWISKCCGAHCGPRDRKCWNCGAKRNRVREAKTVQTFCFDCGTVYYALKWGEEWIGLCPFYFDHHGWNAYYPPNLRPDLLWDLNGYRFDEETKTVTKLRGATE